MDKRIVIDRKRLPINRRIFFIWILLAWLYLDRFQVPGWAHGVFWGVAVLCILALYGTKDREINRDLSELWKAETMIIEQQAEAARRREEIQEKRLKETFNKIRSDIENWEE